MSMHQSFNHRFHFYIEDEMSSVGAVIDWLNSIFNEFEGLQEGLLGGLVVTPAFEGTIISCEYEKGKLMRVLNKGDGDVADLIINGMNMPSIPKELTVKKNATVRGIVTLTDNKAKNVSSSVNELLFKDNLSEDVLSKLIFIPFEWLNDDGKNINTSKEYQLIKDNGFALPAYTKSATVQDALTVYENYCQTDYGYQLKGCRIEIENATTLDTLSEIMIERNLSDYMGRVILLKA
jgi:NAD-dependent DNA ligase